MTEADLMVVSCTNSRRILERNLLMSPDVHTNSIPVRLIDDASSASAAYASVLAGKPAKYVVFAHQDVYLPTGFKDQLLRVISDLDSRSMNWGVIGVYGARLNGTHVGYVYDGSNGRILGMRPDHPTEVAILDEVLLVIRSGTGLNFDPNLPGFHLYGTQIAIAARALDLKVLVADLPIVHNSKSIAALGRDYEAGWQYIARHYGADLPLPNLCCGRTTKTRWPLWKWRLRNRLKIQLGLRQLIDREDDGVSVAQRIGFEGTDAD